MSFFTDTHAHIYLPEFDNDREEVIADALKNGVSKIFVPNIDADSVIPMLKVCSEYADTCFPILGLHPSSVNAGYKNELDKIFTYLEKNRFYGIGETGIDLYWSSEYKNEQMVAFERHIEIAAETNLPLVIHVRNAFDEVFSVLEKNMYRKPKGVFHCFSGNKEEAIRAVGYGFMLGIGGVLTYKNNTLANILEHIDISSIVIETDAPFLAPVPKRGRRNEPAYLTYTAEKISEIYNISCGEAAKTTSENAQRLFNA